MPACEQSGLLDPPQDGVHCHLADLIARLMNRRQRDVAERRERGVVIANQRHVVGHTQSGFVDRVQGTDRLLIVAGEDRGRTRRARQ